MTSNSHITTTGTYSYSFTNEEAKISNECIKFLNSDYRDRELLLSLNVKSNMSPGPKDSLCYYHTAASLERIYVTTFITEMCGINTRIM